MSASPLRLYRVTRGLVPEDLACVRLSLLDRLSSLLLQVRWGWASVPPLVDCRAAVIGAAGDLGEQRPLASLLSVLLGRYPEPHVAPAPRAQHGEEPPLLSPPVSSHSFPLGFCPFPSIRTLAEVTKDLLVPNQSATPSPLG